ncbi:proline-rich receptor-like protein kinase PERK1 isoform X2 [Eucalyptus grandis]|uniref:proline-rich receptor-like protein kinase PERK1 isoform X2 n=1 Tax=Eucalyptus grandis TaxID=71139 RepID=UPI00192E9211|nr:proline-rich receptor-like protein kinase PERK1 isoform X2 [Eucalyptus grandis]
MPATVELHLWSDPLLTKTDVISILHVVFKRQDEAFTSHFSGASLLGRGGYGCVYRGVLPNGEEVAVKRLDVGSGQGESEFLNEVKKINQVHHKHVVSLVGYCREGSERILVYEFVPNGSLESHLRGGGQSTLPWEARMRVAVGSAKGLAYLHEDCHPTIVHRDIKAANILVNFDFEANIADFGLAKSASESNQGESRPVGTFGYVAPEYALGGELTPNLDTFSFGVVLLELITGRRPVGSTHNSLNDNLVYSTRPYLTQALEDGNFDSLVDPRLQNNYNPSEMARMVACAAACVRESAGCRPKMSLIARVLEGHQSAADLDDGTGAGPSNLDLEDGNSNYREPTGGYGLPCPSGSSSEGPSCQTARDLEMGRM